MIRIQSSLTNKMFEAYVLPDPEAAQQPGFDHVPVLVGMDFIRGNSLIVDFTDGYTVCGRHPDAKPFLMPTNAKGHFMLDVIDYLCEENTCHEGHPQIQILTKESNTGAQSLHVDTLEFSCCPMVIARSESYSSHRQLFEKLWNRRRSLQQSAKLMGNSLGVGALNSKSQASLSHGEVQTSDHGLPGCDEEGAVRPSGPAKLSGGVALLQRAQGGQGSKQSMGSLDPLHEMRLTHVVHPEERGPGLEHGEPKPKHDQESSFRSSTSATRRSSSQRDLGEALPGQGDGGRANRVHHGGSSEGDGKEVGGCSEGHGWSSQKLQPEADEGESQDAYFRRLCRGGRALTELKLEDGFSRQERVQSSGLSHGGGEGSHDGSGDLANASSAFDGGGTGVGTSVQLPESKSVEPMKDLDMVKKLPLVVGQKLMDMAHYLQDDLNVNLCETVYGKRPLVWEMFCSKDSELSNACLREGIPVQRINLAQGYDLYKPETYEALWKLFKVQRPKKIWVSTMRTLFCNWVDLNYKHQQEILMKKRRREKKMFRQLTKFLLSILEEDPEVEIYWEWPWKCRAWSEPIIVEFFEKLRQIYDCRIDGCRYGLKSQSGNPMQKPWLIRTTDVQFYSEFRLKVCLKNHTHEWIHGVETNKSAYYPEALCRSIAKHWRKNLLPNRWWRLLWMVNTPADVELATVLAAEGEIDDPDEILQPEEPPEDGDFQPSTAQIEKWEAQLHKFHKAAGHPSARNMVRMLVDAQVEPWKIQQARRFSCDICDELRPGGSSSKQIPPATTRPLPSAWEQVGIDVGEWTVPGRDLKVKFLLMIDIATRYRVTEMLFTYPHGKKLIENTDKVIKAITLRWLMDKPRPHCFIPDNAKSLISAKFSAFMADLGIEVLPPPDHESWAHGVTERAIGQIKEAATHLQQSLPEQDPVLTLAMATGAMNNTEFVKGFSSIQWAYGRQADFSDAELRQQLSLPIDRQQDEFLGLLNQRQLAEECARKAKATTVLSKLKNSSIRQPIRTYQMAQPVFIWRKFLPHTIYAGRKGGRRFVQRPRWVGPGRVVFHELTPGQTDEDRRHIVWVILGNRLYKTSIHSVRPLSEREQRLLEARGDNSHTWKQLSDMIPRREFTDITGEEPRPEEVERPYLPNQPDTSTIIPPKVRFSAKLPMTREGYPVGGQIPSIPGLEDVNEYSPEVLPTSGVPQPLRDDEMPDPAEHPDPTATTSERRKSTSSATPLIDKEIEVDQPEVDPGGDVPVAEPESKRQKTEDDSGDDLYMDLQHVLREVQEGYVMEVEMDFSSNRQRKAFMRSPVAYLTKKVSTSEVHYRNLRPEERPLFDNAKTSEVSSFLKTSAVRRCLSYEENQKAQNSDRVLRARWVLVWKDVPAESRPEAALDRKNNPLTTYDESLTRKAKARIVLLGFQHPDLEQSSFVTTAPVQSQLMKHLSLITVAQRGWKLEGLDMKTAFLQTGGDSMEAKELWTPGVPELRKALGASDGELLRILKNVYGNATAPRGLWEDVDRKFQSLGGHRLVGDSSFWVWTQENPHPKNEADAYELIGYVGGHVDDFARAGDMKNETWLRIRREIDKAYNWGSMKEENFRLTGIDLEVKENGAERYVELSQEFYIENMAGLAISPERLRDDPKSPLRAGEVSACRASLGGLQWIATQTQIQACARVNLLLTELTVNRNLQVAKEIVELIKDIKNDPMIIKLYRLPHVSHWQDWVVVTMADQAHSNRPQGGSTGGLLTCLGGPEQMVGEAGKLNPVAWRTWKLRRKAISTNDSEMQATLEGEDANFRTRWMWCQLNGCCAIRDGNILEKANNIVKYVKGLIATDSKGVYDAVNKNEGPLLGLSNARSALQGHQLKEQLQEAESKLIWISGDWNLGDALTKKAKIARQGLMQFVKSFVWRMKFDPNFIQSEKRARRAGHAAVKQMRELQSLIPYALMSQEEFWTSAMD